jgi:hypothetical protein
MKESISDVKLYMSLHFSSNGESDSKGSHLSDWGKGLIIIYSFLLHKPLNHKMSLMILVKLLSLENGKKICLSS